jgi:hypothetical protein
MVTLGGLRIAKSPLLLLPPASAPFCQSPKHHPSLIDKLSTMSKDIPTPIKSDELAAICAVSLTKTRQN